jgi:hypothetical protein
MDKSERTWKYQLARLGHSCLRIRLSFTISLHRSNNLGL